MKILKALLVVFLILVIVGGIGYIGYNYLYMGSADHGTTTVQETAQPETQTEQQKKVPNSIAVVNQDRLNQAMTLLNQAMDLISLDPYSKVTLPESTDHMQSSDVQSSSGTVNIIPSGNSTVIVPNEGSASSTSIPAADMRQGSTASNNFVYDQGLLTQLHNDIYNVSQGIMMLDQLDDDLTLQAAQTENHPADFQTYVDRYNTAYQNKIKLNNAIGKLNSVTSLVNLNPYATQNGYSFNSTYMDQLHKGISTLAQASVILNQLDNDFSLQMQASTLGASNVINQSGSNQQPHYQNVSSGTLPLDLGLIMQIVLIIFVLGLIMGIIGAVIRLSKRGNSNPPENDNSI